jgi:signal transduction histidine kinase
VLAEQTLQPKQVRFVSHIQDAGRHLLALINDILDLSKVEAGHLELNRQIVPVAALLSDVLTTISPIAAAGHITLENNVGPDVLVRADPLRFKQILFNLVSNAVKFTPDGGKVSVDAVADYDQLTITVSDTGIGIPMSEQQAIFEAFHQVGTTTKGLKEGAGLGLAITKRLVEEHGGRMWVRSQLGEGSHFSFMIPEKRK